MVASYIRTGHPGNGSQISRIQKELYVMSSYPHILYTTMLTTKSTLNCCMRINIIHTISNWSSLSHYKKPIGMKILPRECLKLGARCCCAPPCCSLVRTMYSFSKIWLQSRLRGGRLGSSVGMSLDIINLTWFCQHSGD